MHAVHVYELFYNCLFNWSIFNQQMSMCLLDSMRYISRCAYQPESKLGWVGLQQTTKKLSDRRKWHSTNHFGLTTVCVHVCGCVYVCLCLYVYVSMSFIKIKLLIIAHEYNKLSDWRWCHASSSLFTCLYNLSIYSGNHVLIVDCFML